MNNKYDIFIPGRLCLFGEHSDWASSFLEDKEGIAIVTTTKEGIYAAVSKSNRFIFTFMDKKIDINLDELDKGYNDFFIYVIETFKVIKEKYKIDGIEINITNMDLPIKKGLASSATVCLLIVEAVSIVYGIDFSIKEKIELAYIGERKTGSLCGKLDFISAYGEGIYKVLFKESKIEEVKILDNKNKLYLVFIELKEKDTKKILSLLHDNISKIKDYFYEDKIICNRVIEIIDNDIGELGNLMIEAQNNYEKIIGNIDYILNEDKFKEIYNNIHNKNVLGYKGIGSHGGGAMQILVNDINGQEEIYKVLSKLGYNAYKVTV